MEGGINNVVFGVGQLLVLVCLEIVPGIDGVGFPDVVQDVDVVSMRLCIHETSCVSWVCI